MAMLIERYFCKELKQLLYERIFTIDAKEFFNIFEF